MHPVSELEKGLHRRPLLSVEQTGLSDGLEVEREKKKEVKTNLSLVTLIRAAKQTDWSEFKREYEKKDLIQ